MERVKARHQTVQGNACCGGLQSREHFGACVAVHVTRAVWSRHGGRSLPGNLHREREVSPHFCGLDGIQVVRTPSDSSHHVPGSQGDLRATHPPPALLQTTWVGEPSMDCIVITTSAMSIDCGGEVLCAQRWLKGNWSGKHLTII